MVTIIGWDYRCFIYERDRLLPTSTDARTHVRTRVLDCLLGRSTSSTLPVLEYEAGTGGRFQARPGKFIGGLIVSLSVKGDDTPGEFIVRRRFYQNDVPTIDGPWSPFAQFGQRYCKG